jgi:ketosteroid isomerase-like protein
VADGQTTLREAVRTMNDWEAEIRAREEAGRAAFLAADLATLGQLWAEDYLVNSPLQQVVDRPKVLSLLAAGRIRHTSYEYEIERIVRSGDVVVVMGNDRVTDPPDGTVSRRRFTNVWRLVDGRWLGIARHAHVVSREPGPGATAPGG